MGATAFVGDWGSTKTLRMNARAHQRFQEGWRVVTNYGYVNGETVNTAGDVLRLVASMVISEDMRPVFLGLDEAGRLFPARGWSRWPPAMDLICQEARKLAGGLEFCYTVPDLEDVDKQLRRATSRVVRCKAFFEKVISEAGTFPIRKRPRLSRWVEYKLVQGKQTDKVDSEWRLWSSDAELAETYNTYAVIAGTYAELMAAADKIDGGVLNDEWGDASPTSPVVVAAPSIEKKSRRHRVGV